MILKCGGTRTPSTPTRPHRCTYKTLRCTTDARLTGPIASCDEREKWAKKNPEKAKGSQTQPRAPGKKATADLASDTDVKTGKDKTPKAPRRRIIPKSSKMGDWFGKTPQEKKGE